MRDGFGRGPWRPALKTPTEEEILSSDSPWKPIETAPKDRLILVWAPSYEDLPAMVSTCVYHEDAGWCIDELRYPTHWREL